MDNSAAHSDPVASNPEKIPDLPLLIGRSPYTPYVDIDEQGRATGFAVELLGAVAKTMEIPLRFYPDPWSTVWGDLKDGKTDVVPLVARLPEREGLVEFTRPHTIGYDAFFVRKGRPDIATIEQARHRNIIVLRSDAAHHALLGRGFKRQLIEVDSLADGFRLLASGHHDALLAPLVQGNMQVKRLGLATVIEPGPLLKEYRREFCFAVKKGDTVLRDRLDQGLTIVVATGEYDRLYRKWLGIHEPATFPVAEVLWGAAAATLLFAVLGLWTRQLRRRVSMRTAELARSNESLEQRVAARTLELAESEKRYRALFDSMIEGFALHEIVSDDDGRPCDYRFLEVNPAFETLTGLSRADLIGRCVLDVLPGLEPAWVEQYGKVALTGESAHFESYSESLDCWYEVFAYRPEPRHFAVFFSDITERKRAEQALREEDRRKDEFLAMLAHELRNPLTPISLAAHILEQPGLDDTQLRWAVATISDRVHHITRLVDDLLDVSRISRGRIELKRQRVEFVDLASRAVDSVRPLIEAGRHHLALRLPEGPVYLDADPVRLHQVLVNLLDNAAKYTPGGGHIEFAARVVGGEIEIDVRDDGLGMSADLLPHVFDLFRQGDRTLDRSQGGLGIGLSLAERLVKMHGGRIAAASPGPGKGAVFTVWLPIMVATEPEAAEAPKPLPEQNGMRVLVVDDDRLVAYSLSKMLKLHGYSVRTAASGGDALALVPEFRPQAILLDIGLVGMDGFETARRLRSLPGGDGYRLIAVSGYGDEAALERSKAVGFDAYLIKPVDYRQLAAELSRVDA